MESRKHLPPENPEKYIGNLNSFLMENNVTQGLKIEQSLELRLIEIDSRFQNGYCT